MTAFSTIAVIITMCQISAVHNIQSRNEKLVDLLQSPVYADCKFLVGTEPDRTYFTAHRLILALASPVFADMLYVTDEGTDQCPESDDLCGMQLSHRNCRAEPDERDAIIISDIDPRVFKSVLEYIYKEKMHIRSLDVASELAYASKKYELQKLLEASVSFIYYNTDVNNIGKVYKLAMQLDNDKLKKKSLEIMQYETKLIFSSKNFVNLNIETLVAIFEQDMLNIDSELTLYNAALLYSQFMASRNVSGTCRDPSKTLTLHDAVKNIRFLTLSIEEFRNITKYSALLSNSEAIMIEKKLTSPDDKKFEMPKGFTALTNKRKKASESTRNVERAEVLYCTREFVPETTWSYYADAWNRARFKVDTPICLYGVQIFTRLGNPKKYYREHLKAKVSAAGSDVPLANGERMQRVLFSGTMDLFFEQPCCIEKEQEYDIDMAFFKNASYPKGTGSVKVQVGYATFEFVSAGWGGDVITRSIIFKMNDKS